MYMYTSLRASTNNNDFVHMQYHVPTAILLVNVAGWTVFLTGFGILASW